MPIGVGAMALAAGIAATASTAGTIYNNYQSNLANEEAYERTKELQKLQYEHQKELYEHQFKRESEYNSPAHLRELYEQAGYNPALLAHNGDIGKAATSPAMPSVPSATPFGPRQVFPLDLGGNVGGVTSALMAGSEIKKNDADSFQKIVSSLPELGRSLGWENARQYAKDMLGMLGVSGSQYERQLESVIRGQQIKNEYDSLQLSIQQEFGKANAEVILTNLSLEGHKINAEANELYKRGKLHDAEINELTTRSAKNIAEKAHLNADTKTIDKLRKHVVRSAEMQADLDYYERQEGAALYEQGTKARTWQISEYGKNEALRQQTVENNSAAGLINRIVRGNEKRSKRIR